MPSVDRRWRLWITEEAADAATAYATGAHPHETGGVLVGWKAQRRPLVTRVMEVPSREPRHTYYELSGEDRRAAVAAAQAEQPKIGYLGDWHSHPADAGMSLTDRTTMRRLARDPEAGTKRPTLVIVRRTAAAYVLDGYEFSRWNHRELRVLRAGPPIVARAE